MVDDHETGLLFAPFSAVDLRDKIEYLFARNTVAAQMGKAARAKAEREYSADSHVERLLNVYREAGAPVSDASAWSNAAMA